MTNKSNLTSSQLQQVFDLYPETNSDSDEVVAQAKAKLAQHHNSVNNLVEELVQRVEKTKDKLHADTADNNSQD